MSNSGNIEDMLRTVRKKITKETEGVPLIDFLSNKFTYWPVEKWLEALQDGRSKLNDKLVEDPKQVLQKGDVLSFDVSNLKEPKVDANYQLIHEDENLLIIDKTGDLPIHPAGTFFKNTLWHMLASKYGHIHIMNRLDRETSGLVIVAKNKETAAHLSRQFENRKVRKEYDVLVEGEVPWEYKDAKGFMGPAEGSLIRKKFAFKEDENWQDYGKKSARTEFELLKKHNGFSHLHCKLHTGRTHQIRATLCSLGYPLVGDKIYGVDEKFFLAFIEGSLDEEAYVKLRIERQALHCSLLSFIHPKSGEETVFTSEMPRSIQVLLEDA